MNISALRASVPDSLNQYMTLVGHRFINTGNKAENCPAFGNSVVLQPLKIVLVVA